jgi:hypothetical protein
LIFVIPQLCESVDDNTEDDVEPDDVDDCEE